MTTNEGDEEVTETIVILAEDLPPVDDPDTDIEEATTIPERHPSDRRKTPCGWWSCQAPSFARADRGHRCPVCGRVKSGPPKGDGTDIRIEPLKRKGRR